MRTLPSVDVDAIGRLDATDQAGLVRSGELSAEELVTAAIDRIERVNPALNAVVTPMYEHADELLAAGLPDGPFTGVPYLLKDLAVEYAGARFTEGSAFLRDNVSTVDQELVVRLKRAGLVVVGKTNLCEFGMSPTCESVLFGPARNPWDLTRTTGGSSGGSAAAVAAGLVPFAHGNDAGGSIRFPASCCGLFGFKPTRARVPLGPEYGDVLSGMAAEHALTRSVRDSAALLDATSGPDPGDPYTAPARERPFLEEAGRDPGPLRIAVWRRPPEGQPVHPDCLAALDDTVALLERLGHRVVERELPGLTLAVGGAIGTAYGAYVAWVLAYWMRRIGRSPGPDEIEPLTRLYWERGRRITAAEYLEAIEELQRFSRTVARFFGEVDGWLTPTLTEPPVPLGVMVATAGDPTRGQERARDFVAFPAIIANITGAPAMSVPLHWNVENLPIGVHFLGRYGDDATLFRLAGQLERAQPWSHRWPDS